MSHVSRGGQLSNDVKVKVLGENACLNHVATIIRFSTDFEEHQRSTREEVVPRSLRLAVMPKLNLAFQTRPVAIMSTHRAAFNGKV